MAKTIISPDGKFYDIEDNEVNDAIKNGAKIATPEEIKQYDTNKWAKDSPIEATVQGAASSASFGLSDLAQKELNEKFGIGRSPEELKALEEQNPVASTIGQAAGVLVPIPGSGLVKGANILGKIAEKEVAKVASKIAGREGTSLAKKLIAGMIEKGSGQAVEGALFGAGQAIHESVLNDEELTGEKIASSMAHSAIISGGLSSIFHGGATLVDKGLEKLKGTNILENLPKTLEKQSNEAALRSVGANLKDLRNIDKYSSFDRVGDQIVNIAKTEVDELGNIIKVNNGLKSAFKMDNVDNMISDVEKRIGIFGKKIDEIYTKIDLDKNTQDFFSKSLKEDLLETINKEYDKLKNNRAFTGNLSQIETLKNNYENFEISSFKNAWDELKNIDDQISYDKLEVKTPIQQLLRKLRNTIKSGIDNEIKQVDNKAFNELQTLRNNYQDLKTIQKITDREVLKEMKKSPLSGIDAIIAGLSILEPSTLLALGIKKGIQKYQDPLIATMLKDPEKFQALAKINKLSETFDNKISSSISSFINKDETIPFVSSKINYNYGDKKEEQNDTFKNNFLKLHSQIENLDENTLVDKISEESSVLHDLLPNTSLSMQATTIRATQFLKQKLPVNPYKTDMFKSKWSPTDFEINTFNKYARAVNNPFVILEDLKNNKLTSETVEAVKNVYPNMYNKIVLDLNQKLQEDNSKITYKEKLQLSILFNISIDKVSSPDFILQMQKSFSQENLNKMKQSESAGNIGQNLLTDSQRISNR